MNQDINPLNDGTPIIFQSFGLAGNDVIATYLLGLSTFAPDLFARRDAY